MPIDCNPNDLAKASSCFQCLDAKTLLQVQVYELALIAGVDPDPEALAVSASNFSALSEQQLAMVQAYLLCQILA